MRTNCHITFCCSDLQRAQVQRMEKVIVLTTFNASIHLTHLWYSRPLSHLLDSDKEEGTYCPPVKRERTSSFPPPHSGKATCWLSSRLVSIRPHACSVHSDWYAECNTHLLPCSSQEQCIHALKFLPVSDWELWLWARWGLFSIISHSWLEGLILRLQLFLKLFLKSQHAGSQIV